MIEIARLLLFPLIGLVGWRFSSRQSETARQTVRVLCSVSATVFLGLVVSGWIQDQPAGIDLHKWSGHTLVIVIWLSVPFSIGVALQQHARGRLGVAVTQTTVLLALLTFVILASFTGYLASSDIGDMSEETRNRFSVLHLFALPTLIAILLLTWYWLFRSRTPSETE